MMIFLADGEDVFRIFMVIVFMFVSFMGWVGQFMKNRQQGAQRNRPRPKQDGEVKNEIERFLEEVTGQKKQQPQQRPMPAQRPAPARRAEPQRRPTENQQAKPPARRQPKRRSERDSTKAPSKSQAESPWITSTEQPKPTSRDVPKPTPPAGNFTVPPRRGASAPQNRDLVTTLGSSLAEQLKSPEKVRQAIVLNIILGPPRSKDPSFIRPSGKDDA